MSGYRDGSEYQRAWRQTSIADANRYSVSWTRRTLAQDMLDDMIFDHQLLAASCARSRVVPASDLKGKPQKAPLHTQYPAFPAARACVGLSAIAEYKAQTGDGRGAGWLCESFKGMQPPAESVDVQAWALASQHVAEAVHSRVCIDHLLRFQRMSAVESYRLFAAAMLDFRFVRLRDVIHAAVLLGDFLVVVLNRRGLSRRLHPLTHRILKALAPACRAYETKAADCSADALPAAGIQLARELLGQLVPFLPLPASPQDRPSPAQLQPRRTTRRGLPLPNSTRVPKARRSVPQGHEALNLPLRGLDEAQPPVIEEQNAPRMSVKPEDHRDEERLQRAPTPSSSPEVASMLQQTQLVLKQATQRAAWQDPRVDEVAEAVRRNVFRPGVLEDQVSTHRQKVTVYGSSREGAIQEEILSRSRDNAAVSRVLRASAAIERVLKRFRWFGQRDELLVDRYQHQGGLDPRRLHMIGSSNLLYRRWNTRVVNDYRGRPLIILAKDGSSSNTAQTVFAGQVLAAAFVRIERIARLRVIAADYSSDRASPLVRWLYHPQKTPRARSTDVVGAIASLPASGQGRNEDTLSLSHIVHELPDSMTAGQVIHLINITDGKFNSPLPELKTMVKQLKRDFDLTYSFIVLGNTHIEVPDADHIVHIPATELSDPPRIAQRIGKHINALVKSARQERRGSHG